MVTAVYVRERDEILRGPSSPVRVSHQSRITQRVGRWVDDGQPNESDDAARTVSGGLQNRLRQAPCLVNVELQELPTSDMR